MNDYKSNIIQKSKKLLELSAKDKEDKGSSRRLSTEGRDKEDLEKKKIEKEKKKVLHNFSVTIIDFELSYNTTEVINHGLRLRRRRNKRRKRRRTKRRSVRR